MTDRGREVSRTRRWTLLVALTAVTLVAACTSPPPTFAPPPGSTPIPDSSLAIATQNGEFASGPVKAPKIGALFGAWVKPPSELSQASRITAVTGLEESIGRRLDIVNTYRRFDQPFPTASDLAFAQAGATVMVSWATGDNREITSGRMDPQLVAWAHRFASFPHPILLRVRWEMDRPNLSSVMGSPAAYVAAWKHIRAVFAAQHVTNVSWVWCPTINGFANGTAPAFYPGDNQVDWTCVDVYAGSVLRPMSDLLQPFLTWAAIHPKPIVIGEFGVAEAWGVPAQAAWLEAAQRDFQANPQIKAVSYFDSNPDGNAANQRFLLTRDTDALAAFSEMARAPYFNPEHLLVLPK